MDNLIEDKTRKVVCRHCGTFAHPHFIECHWCHGSGKDNDGADCHFCFGSGHDITQDSKTGYKEVEERCGECRSDLNGLSFRCPGCGAWNSAYVGDRKADWERCDYCSMSKTEGFAFHKMQEFRHLIPNTKWIKDETGTSKTIYEGTGICDLMILSQDELQELYDILSLAHYPQNSIKNINVVLELRGIELQYKSYVEILESLKAIKR